MIIDILCPTRGRPHLARKMYESICATASKPEQVRVWFYLSNNDPTVNDYQIGTWQKEVKIIPTFGPDAPTCWLWNNLATRSYAMEAELFFLMGDDVVFETEGWDEIYRECARSYYDGIFVIAPSDGRGGGIPHPCVSRKWIDTLGYFVNPAFLHWGVDSYTEHLSMALDRIIRLDSVRIPHQKVGEANPVDDTYKRLREGVWNARDLEVLDLMKHRYAEKDIELLRGAMR